MCPPTPQSEASRLLDKLFYKMSLFPRADGLSSHVSHTSDIVIATYPKAGTTLLQNICYQIAVATGGSPPFDPDGTNFDDIDRVAPWIEYAPVVGITDCPSNPRIFKSHGTVHEFDLEKGKFIHCIRNPEAFAASWCDFIFDWISDEKVSDRQVRYHIVQEIFRRKLLAEGRTEGEKTRWKYGSWCTYVRDWTRQPRSNILTLFYEDIVAYPQATVQRIASFMGRSLSDEAKQTVLERCDRGVMAVSEKFRGGIWARAMGLDPAGGRRAMLKKRPGFKEFEIKKESLEMLSKMMMESFGVPTYEEVCDLVKEEWKIACEKDRV
eukprot:GFKZ01003416.1.p1 GENE.GFKZ01003416.1~~GFKZ01003416.1.p1  ORF type:complete len:323 (-),score=36.33 GFKZ01003416.1:105-1073(-)